MDKDPATREREFRETIKKAAKARRDNSYGRRVLKPFASLANALFPRLRAALVLLFLIGFGGLFLYVFGLHAKGTDAYACALSEARRSPDVIAELGEPIEAGFFAWSPSYRQEGSVSDAWFWTSLRGPRGMGVLGVHWYRSPVGSALSLELEKDGRKRVIYNGVIPCR